MDGDWEMAEELHSLADMPLDVFDCLVELLSIQDVIRLGQTCKSLYSHCCNDAQIWAPRVIQRFGGVTDVDRWLVEKRPPLPPGPPPALSTSAGPSGPSPRSAPDRSGAARFLADAFLPSGPQAGPPRTPFPPRLPRSGLSAMSSQPPTPPQQLQPDSYLKLYKLLCELDALCGLWWSSAEPKGSLYSIYFGADAVEGVQLVGHEMTWKLSESRFLSLGGPGRSTHVPMVLTPNRIALKAAPPTAVATPQQDIRRDDRPPSRTLLTDSATLAALSSSPAASSPLGSSPAGSFEYELSRYMHGNVRQNRRGNNNYGQNSPGMSRRASAAGGAASTLHLSRLPPASSSAHPLEGLYKGCYGPHGLEVVLVSRGAVEDPVLGPVLVGTKILGDANVPSGEMTWQASMAPEAEGPETAAILAHAQDLHFYHIGSEIELEDSTSSGSLGGRELSGTSDPGGGAGGMGPSTSDKAFCPEDILAVHRGRGRVALSGYSNASWVDGYLLVLGPRESQNTTPKGAHWAPGSEWAGGPEDGPPSPLPFTFSGRGAAAERPGGAREGPRASAGAGLGPRGVRIGFVWGGQYDFFVEMRPCCIGSGSRR